METGFPSPAQDYLENTIDLNQLIVSNPPATFLMKVKGDNLKKHGLSNGDIVVVDRSSNAVEGQLVVAVEEGLLKLIKLGASDTARQRTFPTEIWGVSKWALKKL